MIPPIDAITWQLLLGLFVIVFVAAFTWSAGCWVFGRLVRGR